MTNEKVIEIEEALRLHINYSGKSSGGEYLRRMDRLAYNYTGAKAIKVSKLLDDYFEFVSVPNLEVALSRLRELELN